MKREFDLLGDPIPENHGGRGRPAHVATAENVRKVRVLLASRMSVAQIAKELGISAPTLRAHYFSSGKIKLKVARQMALDEMRARTMLRLDAEADKGNVTAMRALSSELEKMERQMAEDDLGSSDKPKSASPGVKRQRELAGFEADDALDQELDAEAHDRIH